MPVSVIFCGKTIDLSRYDRHERMDRELLAFTYMHSTSLQMIKKANRYFPIVEPILKENGIPDDFKYLMVIESNLNPIARSSAGAAGLWQFMQGTGRDYGLEVNSNIDERYHVEKATRAACRYLKDAYANTENVSITKGISPSYGADPKQVAKGTAVLTAENGDASITFVNEKSRYDGYSHNDCIKNTIPLLFPRKRVVKGQKGRMQKGFCLYVIATYRNNRAGFCFLVIFPLISFYNRTERFSVGVSL